VYEKVGLRAAFSPTRIALALRAEVSGDSFHAVRVAVCGAGLPAQRLSEVERLLSEAPQRAAVSAASLRETCAADLACDAARIRLTARLLAGHLGCGST
jgi:CO/xanthine dehydrogenase FAD-binding subunit